MRCEPRCAARSGASGEGARAMPCEMACEMRTRQKGPLLVEVKMEEAPLLGVGVQVTVREVLGTGDGGVGEIVEMYDDGSVDVRLVLDSRKLKRVQRERIRVGNHAGELYAFEASAYKHKVDEFFALEEGRYGPQVAVLHLDDLIDKRSSAQVEYVLEKLEATPRPPVQVAFFQGAIPLQNRQDLFERFLKFLVREKDHQDEHNLKVDEQRKIVVANDASESTPRVWSLNLGELNLDAEQLGQLRDALAESGVTHMFYECNNLFSVPPCTTEECASWRAMASLSRLETAGRHSFWKDLFREIVRTNRTKHDLYKFSHDRPDQNAVILKAVKNWFNPTGHKENKAWLSGHRGGGGDTVRATRGDDLSEPRLGDRVVVLGESSEQRGVLFQKGVVALDAGGRLRVEAFDLKDLGRTWNWDDEPRVDDVVHYEFSRLNKVLRDADVLIRGATNYPGWFDSRSLARNFGQIMCVARSSFWHLVHPAGTTAAAAFRAGCLSKQSSTAERTRWPPATSSYVLLKCDHEPTGYCRVRVVRTNVGQDPSLVDFFDASSPSLPKEAKPPERNPEPAACRDPVCVVPNPSPEETEVATIEQVGEAALDDPAAVAPRSDDTRPAVAPPASAAVVVKREAADYLPATSGLSQTATAKPGGGGKKRRRKEEEDGPLLLPKVGDRISLACRDGYEFVVMQTSDDKPPPQELEASVGRRRIRRRPAHFEATSSTEYTRSLRAKKNIAPSYRYFRVANELSGMCEWIRLGSDDDVRDDGGYYEVPLTRFAYVSRKAVVAPEKKPRPNQIKEEPKKKEDEEVRPPRRARRTVARDIIQEMSSADYTRALREKKAWCEVETLAGHRYRAKLGLQEARAGIWKRPGVDEDDAFVLAKEDWETQAVHSTGGYARLEKKYVGIVFRDVEFATYDQTFVVKDVVRSQSRDPKKPRWELLAVRINDETGEELGGVETERYGVDSLIREGLVGRAPVRLQSRPVVVTSRGAPA